jgi:hypothetical protein
MTEDKKRRVAAAVGFLSGTLSCLDALRDSKVFWPPDAVWSTLRHSQRLELGGGLALIVVVLVIMLVGRGASQ